MDHPIVLFDGICALCNATVQFALKQDPQGKLRFAGLQSTAGRKLLQTHGLPGEDFDTVLLIEGDRVSTHSTGALRILRYLRFPWPLLYGLILIPPFIRDRIYALVARRRFDWFGKLDACPIPPPEVRDRFLSGS